MRASAAIAKRRVPGLAVRCTKHNKSNTVTNQLMYWGIYEKRCFGCDKENSADILYWKVLQYSLLLRHSKVVALEVLQNI